MTCSWTPAKFRYAFWLGCSAAVGETVRRSARRKERNVRPHVTLSSIEGVAGACAAAADQPGAPDDRPDDARARLTQIVIRSQT